MKKPAMKTREELGVEILDALASIERVMPIEVSLHYGQGVCVLGFQSQKPAPIGSDGSRDNAERFRRLVLAYRVACQPGAIDKVERADRLSAAARTLTDEASALLRDVPWDVAQELRVEET